MDNIIFHIDVNSAFLSWSATHMLENGYETDIREIPSIIGGDQQSRHGIVLAKSIPAKAYGIVTGEPIVNAKRKCPTLSVYPSDHNLYKEKSKAMIDYLKTLTSDIEQVSIDECFLFFTPISQKYSSAVAAATQIKDTIYEKFGFTVNIGISDKKVLAKMASDFKKPNLVHTLYQREIKEKMWPLPVSDLFGCGKSSVETLKKLEINTIGDLAKTDPEIIKAHLKSHGYVLWQYANGIDDSVVETQQAAAKGVGNSHTLSKDATTKEEAYAVLLSLADSVATRLRKTGVYASMVSVEIKYSNFRSVSHQCLLNEPANTAKIIYETACSLFDNLWDLSPIRLLGIRTSKLTDALEPTQLTLFDYMNTVETTTASSSPAKATKKQENLELTLDKIREKYGKNAIVRGSNLKK
ncbi:MAG: DNA polymerase IV [Lachnospiraceae bacterium]|nr:DNA polymerase IV [Lachnospiraceae bacterium]